MKKTALAAALFALASFSAHGADLSGGFANGGWSAQYGVVDGNHRATLNYETSPLWHMKLGSTRLELVGELGGSYWWTSSALPGYARHMWQLNAIPMFRWWPTERFYIEGGIGATAVSETKFHDKNISSTFQFGDHIGAGFKLAENMRLGLRVSHFSNGGMKKPNQGLNQVQLNFAMGF
ncbi:acyloxyacyl hydrolase [Pigmentiphaga sp. H8]|uniref:acyloxyacyl hydrolase n=1 Tax=Pigmentiphaga sp. H8 TaxID=2488560 RepID=UPI000F5AA521|nr:acyloxyacyl hydrolase [Pigmentiphaga sp. H8]AZG09239.1 acyloxyacyl hydrolase [Pigmentiphaga sp. H8]